jgi:hypothetical protein
VVPGALDITIYQGADWTLPLTWLDDDGDPYDLSGWDFRVQIRDTQNDVLLAELSTGNGKIVVGSTSPNITLALPHAETAAYSWVWGIWELEPTEPGGGIRPPLLKGRAVVEQEIAR